MICQWCRIDVDGGYHSAEFCIERLAEVVNRVYAGLPMIVERPPVDHDAYRHGLCCECAEVPYSAGRPRCAPCHAKWEVAQPTFDFAPGLDRGALGVCSATDCSYPTMPGRVLCASCTREKKESR